jgi:hypothetical protein
LDNKLPSYSDRSVRGMQQSTPYRRHGAYGRQGKMLYHDLRLHSSGSALKTHRGKALWLVEIRLGTREGIIAEGVMAADDISVHPLNVHGHHRPGNQDAGTPGWLPFQTRREGHTWDKRFVGIAAHTWCSKIENEKVPSSAEFDFQIALRPHDETWLFAMFEASTSP